MKTPQNLGLMPALRTLPRLAFWLSLLLLLAPGRSATAAPVRLTFSGLHDISPRWHPNGNTIAYMKLDASSNWQPGTVNVNGTGEAFLATGVMVAGNSAAISWLGNSSTLLVAEINVFHELFAFNTALAPFTRTVTDGNDAAFTRKLFVPGGTNNSNAFISSRDGLIVAWRDSLNAGTSTTIRSATFASLSGQNTNAVGTIVVSSNAAGNSTIGSRGMALTPNGAQLVISIPSGTGLDLWIYNTNGTGTPVQLTTDGGTAGMFNLSPDVSPDGTRILFQRGTSVAGSPEIYRMNINGTALSNVTNSPGVDEASPSWAPNGIDYAFQRYDGTQWDIYKDVLDTVTQTPTLTAPVSGTSYCGSLSIAYTLPEAALAGSVKLTFTGTTTVVLTVANSEGTAGAHAFSFSTANPTASPQIASGSAIPDGAYNIVLSYQDAAGNPAASSASASDVFLDTTPIGAWKLANFGTCVLADAGDPDHDGLRNLAEYALLLSPTAPSQAPGASLFTYAEGRRLRMFVPRDPAHSDITVSVEATGDLIAGPWTPLATSTLGVPFTGPGYVGGDSATPGVKTVEVRDTVSMSTATQRWLRVKVTR